MGSFLIKKLKGILWFFSFLLVGLCLPQKIIAHDLRGFVAVESRLFYESAIHSGQEDHSFSGVAQPEYLHTFKDGSNFTFIPFYRWDSADSERTHFDLRELNFISVQKDWEFRFGVRKEFWGTVETQHLVDIINQTDLIENIDAEEKLGQPMANLSIQTRWGILDFFWLPYFRERTFAGRGGRLRPSIVVDTDQTVFESAAEEWHQDFAFRYFNTIGQMDIGLSHFVGTGREPSFLFDIDSGGTPFLIPFYEQINQTGIDALYVIEKWIWKLEAIYRIGQGEEDFFASTFGFEYTFDGIYGTGMDLGILGEWSYDDRHDNATSPLENDITFGLRLALNDVEGTTILIALVQDLDSDSRFYFIEATTLLTEHWRISLEMRGFFDQPKDDLLIDFRDDDHVQLELAYHF